MALAREPRTSPIVPSYGDSSLADLSASVLASLTGDAAANVLGLPNYPRVCLLLIDGLGYDLLRAHQAAAPFLAELAFNSRPLTAGCPSTTVTSLASLGTALPPAAHGMLGYQVAVPGEDRLLNGLRWPDDVDPAAWQPRPTIFERAAAAGVTPVHVSRGAFRNSGLTRAALRGAEYRPADSLGALAALSRRTRSARPSARWCSPTTETSTRPGTCTGWPRPPGTTSSRTWTSSPSRSPASLPYGAVLYVTADHGMVDVGPDDRIDADEDGSPLRDGVALLGGEARVRHVYTRPGAAEDVLADLAGGARRAGLGAAARGGRQGRLVRSGRQRGQRRMAPRIGDVVAACAGSWAVVASRAEPHESSLIGMHGSLTAAEQLVPMLTPGR